ncbi:MAG: hypothetical protein BYD32DRAFT_455365 [Podila humilis]|nr:MAG: hypothetical protein BYD32DRAFT_455365 [Podila humilis]
MHEFQLHANHDHPPNHTNIGPITLDHIIMSHGLKWRNGKTVLTHQSTPQHLCITQAIVVSDGHRTSSERNSPYTRQSQSRSRSPPSPQRESRTSRNANRTPRPVQVSGQQGSACAPSQDTASADGVTLQQILFSLEMAKAEQGNWFSQSQGPKVPSSAFKIDIKLIPNTLSLIS